jgi:hypothetical protein
VQKGFMQLDRATGMKDWPFALVATVETGKWMIGAGVYNDGAPGAPLSLVVVALA